MKSNSEKPTLLIHEWLAVVTIVGFMAMLTAISKPASISLPSSTDNLHFLMPPYLEVEIDGAVENPGKYKLKKGSALKDLLAEAKCLPEAQLKKFNREAKLRKGQRVHIPYPETITVYLEGAVHKPGPYEFLKGTRLIDLKEKNLFIPEADLSILNKKRRLKHKEVISIP